MAHLIEPLEMRDQLYDFLSNHAMLTEIATWSKSLLDVVPDEADSAGKAFPVAAVTWHYEWNAMETSPIYAGGTDRRRLLLWVCLSCKASIADGGSDVTSTDQAVRLANLVELVLRSNDGRALSYGGNTAAQGVATPEMRIRVARKDTDLKKWYSTVYIRVEITNIRGQIS